MVKAFENKTHREKYQKFVTVVVGTGSFHVESERTHNK